MTGTILENQGVVPRFQVIREIFRRRSDFHDIAFIEAKGMGKLLVLDSVIQISTADHFFFHEMLVHVPLLSLNAARRVLVIGVGSGGVLGEIFKHPEIQEVVALEIDPLVVHFSEKHLPELNQSGEVFRDPRLKLHFEEASQFLQKYRGEPFDAILVNSTDPNAVSNPLFTQDFYRRCKEVLQSDGVLVAQTGAPTLEKQLVRDVSGHFRKVFPWHGCYLTCVPAYMCGYFTLSWASSNLNLKVIPSEALQKNSPNCWALALSTTPDCIARPLSFRTGIAI